MSESFWKFAVMYSWCGTMACMNRSRTPRRAERSSASTSIGSGRLLYPVLVSSRRSSYVLAMISRPVATSTILKVARVRISPRSL